jgi:hypothetical protein
MASGAADSTGLLGGGLSGNTGTTSGDFGAAPHLNLNSSNVGGIIGAPQWGAWTDYTFANPTEQWQTQWNSLDSALRPYYAMAATQNMPDSDRYSESRLGFRPIYAALESNAPDLFRQAQQESAQFSNTPGVNNWRLSPTGELQQMQGGNWTTIANNLTPGVYVPHQVGDSSAWQGYLAAITAAGG